MNPVDALFLPLRADMRKAFIPFLTAGDPDADTTACLLPTVAASGADLIEVGFAFSDPLADGQVIQASYTRALVRGLKIDQVFDAVRRATTSPGFSTPVVGMVSYSLIHRRGPETFVAAAKAAGLSGLIVPDLVADEADAFAAICRNADCKLILLVTPTTARTGPRRSSVCVAGLCIASASSASPASATRCLLN